MLRFNDLLTFRRTFQESIDIFVPGSCFLAILYICACACIEYLCVPSQPTELLIMYSREHTRAGLMRVYMGLWFAVFYDNEPKSTVSLLVWSTDKVQFLLQLLLKWKRIPAMMIFTSDYLGHALAETCWCWHVHYLSSAVGCPILSKTITDGVVTGTSYTFQDSVVFTCNTGSYITGLQVTDKTYTLICGDDRKWNGTQPTCSGERRRRKHTTVKKERQSWPLKVQKRKKLISEHQTKTGIGKVEKRFLHVTWWLLWKDKRWLANQPAGCSNTPRQAPAFQKSGVGIHASGLGLFDVHEDQRDRAG